MPLEHILCAMQAQADAEIQAINQVADEEVAQIVAEAESRAQAVRSRHRARVQPRLAVQAAGLQDKAKVTASRVLADAREQMIAEAFAQAGDCLSQIRKSAQYGSIFRALAQEAVQALIANPSDHRDKPGEQGPPDLVARVDERDGSIASDTFADLCVNVVIETGALPLGGLELSRGDRRIIVANTIDDRLKRARETQRGTIARILTGAKNKEWETNTVTPTHA